MSKRLEKINILGYLHNQLSKESVDMIYSANNIMYDKCVLYNDFTQSLMMLVFDTYLGDEHMVIEDQIKHFRWCWNKVVSNFKEEGIHIKNPKLYNYFLEFMLEVFYMYEGKQTLDYTDTGILKIWENVFTYDKPKTQADIDTLVEIYKLYEKALIFE